MLVLIHVRLGLLRKKDAETHNSIKLNKFVSKHYKNRGKGRIIMLFYQMK